MKKLFFEIEKVALQKVSKWYKTLNSIENFLLLSLVVDQHKAKGHAEVKFIENAITL